MAKYHYDEAGNMAAYFLLTFLALILVPFTLSSLNSSKKSLNACKCTLCLENRRKFKSLVASGTAKKTYFLAIGWAIFAYVSYKVAHAKIDHKVYDPFEILGIKSGSAEKEIKAHFKKLSRLYHPDKVKVTVNNTVEMIQNRFVEITKAYKSLTDETIRENLEKYGHPDGRQDVSMGIALPPWIVEARNNVWVLGAYGLVFGGALPAFVGRWWFGSRQKTKDGVNASSAAAFFKNLKEESSMDEVVAAFCKAYQWESPLEAKSHDTELDHLRTVIAEKLGSKWDSIEELCGDNRAQRRALILLHAHLLRIPVSSLTLQREQAQLILQTPSLLNSLLNITISRNWLLPTLSVMQLHAYISQALPPGAERLRFLQLPGIEYDELSTILSDVGDLPDVLESLEQRRDPRVGDVKQALQQWGRIELVDATFKVIGERIIIPSSIVFLVVKLRLSPPGARVTNDPAALVNPKRSAHRNEERDEQFLSSRKDAEDIPLSDVIGAHSPYWPSERKPAWWIVLSDEKSNRVVVPPLKVTDVPFSSVGQAGDYRSYKIQFQAPQSVGLFTWKVQLVSDTFVGEDVAQDITLKIEDASALEVDEPSDDDISDPEEDSIAGQMAAMRGGPVKSKVQAESDDESSTDDDEDSDMSTSDSDSE